MDSIEETYKKHSKMIYYFLLSRMNNPEVAEELTQETFYQALKGIDKFQGKSSISTWLCGIANNVCMSYLRKNKQNLKIDEVENELSIRSVEETFFCNWDSIDIMKMLHRLKEPTREVLYLRLIGNLSFRDIGEIIGKNENWARVTFYRGKEKIIEEVKTSEK